MILPSGDRMTECRLHGERCPNREMQEEIERMFGNASDEQTASV